MSLLDHLAQRHWTDLALIGTAALWIVLTAWAVVRRRSGDPIRTVDRLAVVSTILLALAWFVSFRHAAPPVESSTKPAAARTTATCASISLGMTSEQVRAKMGDPDEVTSAEDIRGPGAERWTYSAVRCRVHLVDDRVTSID